MSQDILRLTDDVILAKDQVGFCVIHTGDTNMPLERSLRPDEVYTEADRGGVEFHVGTGDPEDDQTWPDITVTFDSIDDDGTMVGQVVISGMVAMNPSIRDLAISVLDALLRDDSKPAFLRWCAETFTPVEFDEVPIPQRGPADQWGRIRLSAIPIDQRDAFAR